MSTAAERGRRDHFARALLDAHPACPPGMDRREARRFRVYRNNVHRALHEALCDAYPVVRQLVGDAYFAALARDFFLAETVRPASLALYGAGFPEHVARFPGAASLPYLADVARLERAWLEALHAADRDPLPAAALAAMGEGLQHARFDPHPAARLVSSRYPVARIWHAHLGDGLPAASLSGAEHALVTRPHLEVRVTALRPAAGDFARRLLDGASPAEAHAAAVSAGRAPDVALTFSRLLEAGAFTRARHDRGAEHDQP